MRTIRKGSEPPSLTQHRKQQHANYDNYADKASLRQALVAEQRGLCCYCQSRIRATREGMKIEHWESQEHHSARQLDFGNLLGACLGGGNRPKRDCHCDTFKGSSGLCFSVCDPDRPIELKIQFLGNGVIKSDDKAVNDAINKVLNLNLPRLVNNRKAVLVAFQQGLQLRGSLNPARELPNWDGSEPGALPEFAQVVVYWLRKRQARAAG